MSRFLFLILLVAFPPSATGVNPLGGNGATAAEAALHFLTGEGQEDAMSKDPELNLAQRLIKGDKMGVLSEMMANTELDELWSDPAVAHRLLQGFPMFRMLNGVGPIMDKKEEDLTPRDGMTVLSSLRAMAQKGAEHMMDAAGQTGMVNKLQEYADKSKSDPYFASLFAKMEAGDESAGLELHDRVFEDIWGGTVNKEVFGTPDREPDLTVDLRRMLMDEEPELYRLITNDDPVLKQILENPTYATKAARELSAAGAAAQKFTV